MKFKNQFNIKVSWKSQLACVAAVASIFLGYNLSVLNTLFHILTADFKLCGEPKYNPLNPNTIFLFIGCRKALRLEALLNGTFVICCAIGCAVSGIILSNFGRRKALLVLNIIVCISSVISALAWNLFVFVFARILGGLASGLATVIPGVYIIEMTPLKYRSKFSIIPQIAVNVGIALGIIVGLPLINPKVVDAKSHQFSLTSNQFFHNRIWWRFTLLIPVIVSLIVLLLLIKVYWFDTPVYLYLTGKVEDAKAISYMINFNNHNKNFSTSTHTNRMFSNETQSAMPNLSHNTILNLYNADDCNRQCDIDFELKDVFSNKVSQFDSANLKNLCIGVFFAMAQQSTGINVFVAMSNMIFESAGIPISMLTYMSVTMVLVGLICALIAPFLIEKMPRRHFLIGGAFLMSMAFVPSFITWITTPTESSIRQIFALVSTMIFFISYNFSYGPGLFLYLSELFKPEIKDKSLAIAYTLNWITGFILVSISPLLTQKIIFILFSSLCLLSCNIAYFIAPETIVKRH